MYGRRSHRFNAAKDSKQQVKNLKEHTGCKAVWPNNGVNEQKEEKYCLSKSATVVFLLPFSFNTGSGLVLSFMDCNGATVSTSGGLKLWVDLLNLRQRKFRAELIKGT